MAIMGTNVQLHLRAGLLLLAAYAIVLLVGVAGTHRLALPALTTGRAEGHWSGHLVRPP